MMKKIILSLCLLGLTMTAGAQENGAFVTVGVGTKLYDRAFRGADISMQAGYNYKGMDVSAQISYYTNQWGGRGTNTISYNESEGQSNCSHFLDERWNETFMTLRLSLGYDVLRFIRGNWRHHIRPYAGLGYSLCHNSNNSCYRNENTTALNMTEWTEHGFDFSLGIAYDFNITRHWALGTYIEAFPMIRDQAIMGLHIRYSF